MKGNTLFVLVLVLVICGGVPSVYADNAVAPVSMTAPAVSAPTPAISTSQGTVSALDVTSATPWLKIKDEAGKDSTIMIAPSSSTAWKGGNKATWTDVKVGDKVKVRHTEKDGKMIARTVEIV